MPVDGWKATFAFDLEKGSATAFAELVQVEFPKWSGTQAALGPLGVSSGWHIVNPQMCEEFLRRNRQNRKVSLTTVKKYARAMIDGQWKATGQGLLFDKDGWGVDLQHRCWAGYLSGCSFPSYIITDVEPDPVIFAYIDDNKVRSGADHLYTAGVNGLSAMVAGAIKIEWRYQHNALSIFAKRTALREITKPEILGFAQTHPDLANAAHILVSSYGRALKVIYDKDVAAFFAWKVLTKYDSTVLAEFLTPLGSGAELAAENPILALRNRLLSEQDDLTKQHVLALLIKAFNMHVAGEKVVVKKGLHVRDNEPFPRFAGDDGLESPVAAE